MMIKNKDELEHNDNEFNKWDIILANILIASVVAGFLIAGAVIINMTN